MTATLAPADSLPTTPSPERRFRYEYPALAVLLLGTGLAYLCNLSANGWANSFYSAAVQAGSVSWKAFFFGSSDAANSITVDKPPASLWLMELSVRAFGLNSWSMLVPEVLLGVASVALLWATVRRPFGPAAGLLAGLLLAVTPVAVLMFRFNNPEALLVFLMVAAAWAMTRAIEDGRWRWLVLTGVFVGLGFLTKQLQVLLIVPPLALAYLLAGPPALGKRVLQLLAAAVAMVAAAGWWLLAVELWPTSSRPWIGGSQHNSILELTLGYNGLGRLTGEERGSVGPGGGEMPTGGNGMWGSTGITRMFEPAQGGQIAWLIPAALVALVAGVLLRGKAPRTDSRRAALLLWGGWLLVTGLTFSFMAGIFHQYYTVALAPAVAALVGAGAVLMWRERHRLWVRSMLALAVGLTTATGWMLLSRSVHWLPWLRWTVLVVGVLATIAVLVPASKKLAVVSALAIAFTGLAGQTAYAVNTVATSHDGAIPLAGPNVGLFGGPGMIGRPPEGMDSMPGGPDGARPGNGPMPGTVTTGRPGREMVIAGGLLGASKPSEKVVALLEQNGTAYTWAAAAVGSNSAAGFQLATELPVMPIGGFNGSDPSPTLEQFEEYVAQGKIHYFLGGGHGGDHGGFGPGSSGTGAQITQWVQEHFTATEVDGVTLYDLTTPRG
ncbi:4-amino-4-deoxy-L-arabinose transferase-like glycosyltransferase [Nocardia tenerifensis]|uniref:4-amino-4-deoxy-L-arabinose transferase-like glycosyltransferase n=1 Tax=Nocardia tenerifensis TaxID=228006 RepID=A0A318K7L5_9NOCA|nr:glycosyltransferase family 39 protein [Nocardia tenerifensis]PXX65215.1 4-amino-4-deoxy-L-arabinose transferase-like glycosyltransferase [Nocardia tenerifensis]